MEDQSTPLTLLPRDAQTRLFDAACAYGRRELTRIAYLYLQTLDDAREVVELLLGTAEKPPATRHGAQTAGTSPSSYSPRCDIQ